MLGGEKLWIVADKGRDWPGYPLNAIVVQTALAENPFNGHVFIFRGRRGDIIKVLWFDGQGLMLLAKRLERGRFVWPQASSGSVSLTPAKGMECQVIARSTSSKQPSRTMKPLAAPPSSAGQP